ncbi:MULTISPECIES: TIGR02391 family protein [Streptomyces]|uniref:TIGR02391 family protein n=1 Tax=Streptomyces TaxID=1883 RepID=UPI00240E0C28|nr:MULTISPECIES: TIGR02391 family protein [Streptomyces]WFB83735.1 TIGR02391 family protein [Streptomyces olivaceus]WGK50647.1 TIGR02391 family protein [Streptomyces sp. B146]
MDHAFAVRKLTDFLALVGGYLYEVDLASRDIGAEWPDWPEELVVQEAVARQIVNAYSPGLGDVEHEEGENEATYWYRVRTAAAQALGMASSAEEIAAFLRPVSPALAADSLHPWVWEPAAPLWAAEARQDAVLAAARTLNRRLQQKLGRHDIGETDLCMQTFDLKEAQPGKPRLRFPGDRMTATWRARQEGAKYFGAGAFLAIRNVAAHEEAVGWSRQDALEHLAVLSVLARWIEQCTTERVSSTDQHQ